MRALKWLKEQFFPERLTCELCGREIFDGGRLCGNCAKAVVFNNGHTCAVCGRRAPAEDEICLECKERAPLFKKGVSALIYKDGSKDLIYKFKNGHPYLKDYFSELLYEKCAKLGSLDGVVCIPAGKRVRRKRGYNQAELIAKELAKRLNAPFIKDALVKIKNTKRQKSLSQAERESNLAGAFKADADAIRGKVLLLVDDVMTTGATADVACLELKRRGAKRIYFAAVASVEYQNAKI